MNFHATCDKLAVAAALALPTVVSRTAAHDAKLLDFNFGVAAALAATVVLVIVFANRAIEPHTR